MVNSISLNAYSYNGIVSGGGSKLYVPVKPAYVIYAQFDHVSGVAAKGNQKSVSVSKIQILNSLLNQLISMKKAPQTKMPENMTNDQLDALIHNAQSNIKAAVQTAEITGYGLAGAAPQTGVMFSAQA